MGSLGEDDEWDMGDMDKEWGELAEMEEDCLQQAEILSSEEVVQRRLNHTKKLMNLYRSQYWALAEEMRSKHRKFFIKHGKGGWLEAPGDHPQQSHLQLGMRSSSRQEPHAPERPASATLHCAAAGPCYRKPLALTGFCFNHILLAPRQKLYKPCIFAQNPGEAQCGRPVLCAVKPLLCPQHQAAAQKQGKRTSKNGASLDEKPGVFPGSKPKVNLKLHHIITEYVRQIQHKRRCLVASDAPGQAQKVPTKGNGSSAGEDRALKEKCTSVPVVVKSETIDRIETETTKALIVSATNPPSEPTTAPTAQPPTSDNDQKRLPDMNGNHLELQLATLDPSLLPQVSAEAVPKAEKDETAEGLTAVGFPPQQAWPYGHSSYGYQSYSYGHCGGYFSPWSQSQGAELAYGGGQPFVPQSGTELQELEGAFAPNQEVTGVPQVAGGACAWGGGYGGQQWGNGYPEGKCEGSAENIRGSSSQHFSGFSGKVEEGPSQGGGEQFGVGVLQDPMPPYGK